LPVCRSSFLDIVSVLLAMIADEDEFSSSCVVLCVTAPSFSVKLVSKLFVELGGHSMVESTATNYRVVVDSVDPNIRSVEGIIAEQYGLSAEKVSSAIVFLKNYAHDEAQKATVSPMEHIGFVIGLAHMENGALFVCELNMVGMRHQRLGWSYLVGWPNDITSDLSIEQLVGAASHEDYNDLIDNQVKKDISRRSMLHRVWTSSLRQRCDKLAEQMWGHMLLMESSGRDRWCRKSRT